MTSEQARKYTVIFMFVLTLVVGVAAVYIGIRLQQSQAPTNSNADSCTACNAGDLPICQIVNGKYSGYICTCVATLCNNVEGNYRNCTATSPACPVGGSPTTSSSSSATTSTPSGGTGPQCPDTTKGNSKWCVIFRCPNGDTNNDGKCEAGDTGMTQEFRSGSACPNPTSPGLQCYQIDYYDRPDGVNASNYTQYWTATNFCGHVINLQGCGTATSTSTSTSTPQVCQQVKLVNEGQYSDLDGDGDSNNDGVIVKDIKVGQTVTFRGIVANCPHTAANDTQRDKMMLVVFSGQDRTNYDGSTNVGVPIPAVVTNATYEGGLCKYDFTWTATNVPVLASGNYKVRLAKDGQGGNNPANGKVDAADIYWDPGACTYKVDIVDNSAPLCGDSCSATTDCPTNHTCVSNKCVLTACTVSGTTCDANKCNVITDTDLPSTGLFDEDGRPVLLGLMLILFGILVNRLTGGMSLLATNVGTIWQNAMAARPVEEAKKARKYDEDYEHKILDKKNN